MLTSSFLYASEFLSSLTPIFLSYPLLLPSYVLLSAIWGWPWLPSSAIISPAPASVRLICPLSLQDSHRLRARVELTEIVVAVRCSTLSNHPTAATLASLTISNSPRTRTGTVLHPSRLISPTDPPPRRTGIMYVAIWSRASSTHVDMSVPVLCRARPRLDINSRPTAPRCIRVARQVRSPARHMMSRCLHGKGCSDTKA